MGQQSDARIADFRVRNGIQLPTAERREWIGRVKRAAVELIEVMVLEEAGIRDGDGYWHGSDVVEGAFTAIERLQEIDPGHYPTSAADAHKAPDIQPLGVLFDGELPF